MTAPLDWRRVEAALVEELRRDGWDVDTTNPDAHAYKGWDEYNGSYPRVPVTINLTALAKHLADELGGTT